MPVPQHVLNWLYSVLTNVRLASAELHPELCHTQS